MAEEFDETENEDFHECFKRQRIDRYQETKANDKRFVQDLVICYIKNKVPRTKAIKDAITALKSVEDALEKHG